jgi:hypothetical protein
VYSNSLLYNSALSSFSTIFYHMVTPILWWTTSVSLFAGPPSAPEDHPLLMLFCEWLRHQHAADARYENILWTYEEWFTREGAFNVRNSHLWSRANPLASRARGYQVRYGVIVWSAWHSRGHLHAATLAGYLLDSNVYFFKLYCRGLLEDVPPAVWQATCIQHDTTEPRCTMGKMYQVY